MAEQKYWLSEQTWISFENCRQLRLWMGQRADEQQDDLRKPTNRSDLDAMIVFGANPEHTAGVIAIFDDLGSYHCPSALRACMLIMMPLVAEAGSRGLRNLFCH